MLCCVVFKQFIPVASQINIYSLITPSKQNELHKRLLVLFCYHQADHTLRTSKQFSEKVMTDVLHAKYPLFLSYFNEIWVLSTDFRKTGRYKMSSKSVQQAPNCSLWTYKHPFAILRTHLKILPSACKEFYILLWTQSNYHPAHYSVNVFITETESVYRAVRTVTQVRLIFLRVRAAEKLMLFRMCTEHYFLYILHGRMDQVKLIFSNTSRAFKR